MQQIHLLGAREKTPTLYTKYTKYNRPSELYSLHMLGLVVDFS
jgi:hypothetical protein